MTIALRAGKQKVHSFDPNYDPFKGVQPSPAPRPVMPIDPARLEAIENPRTRVRLKGLTALLKLGLTLPEACSRRGNDISFKFQVVYGYKRRYIPLDAEALDALLHLARLYREEHYGPGILGWKADTARRWLKQVVEEAE